tara:strand:+ start:968 stop:1612 length:645 start_codon:yes stop_codon:yes gene_type:complete
MECADDSCAEEALEGQLFCKKHRSQIAAIEDLQCPTGCGRLSYGRVGWPGHFGVIIFIAGAIAFIGFQAELSWLFLAAIPVAAWAFASNEGVTGRYKCDICHGEMYDSKTMVEMMSAGKATTIERLLESGTPSANKRQCPRCESGMVRISIDYVEPDRHHGGNALGLVISAIDAMIPNPTKHLDLEGCQTCGMFWFDSGELAKISGSESMKGGS